ncbi:tail fiber protein [Oceanicella actignis]|uniref:Microcystin-dependent protein n=1 Tax=Oceanicella actignis TaxID=1189325 RepID=A0A1M7TC91_9RHOB|nr:tail fiber protein [Oceanicella actignis]SET54908.1 Microcystin-dependent protein [Oceanicella actignis]SHN68306.1 Microcystin-dependent protein [Oceanicella actignis]
MRTKIAATGLAAAAFLWAPGAQAFAIETETAGAGAPFAIAQPRLALTPLIRTEGAFEDLGQIKWFAGSVVPQGYARADGQLLPIAQNPALFSRLGTTYGGDGEASFALPDLRGRTIIGAGAGPGLTPRFLGETVGAETATMTEATMPRHAHPFDGGEVAASGGGGAISNMMPSLALNMDVALQGVYGQGPTDYSTPSIGMVNISAALGDQAGFADADGAELRVSDNPALFSLYGVAHGGDGRTTFALPDLRGRAARGAAAPSQVGAKAGDEVIPATADILPAHAHDSSAGAVGEAGAGAEASLGQPTLDLLYGIALWGAFPTGDLASSGYENYLGEIALFGGPSPSFWDAGVWAPADGRLLSIGLYPHLFSVIGTIYGGDGRTTFALPDLRGRTPIGADPWPGGDNPLGRVSGQESLTLTAAHLAPHSHAITLPDPPSAVPLPSALPALLAGLTALGGLGAAARRRRGAAAGR